MIRPKICSEGLLARVVHLTPDQKFAVFKSHLGQSVILSFPGGSDGEESACNAGDLSSVPVLERPPGEGNGNLLQFSYLENPMDRGAWQPTVHGVAKNQT